MRFEGLRETLLKGGVAPRHVRRYLAELSAHLDDLTVDQHKLGYDGEDANLRARALLGEDRELAAAMLEQKSLRSVAARASSCPSVKCVPAPASGRPAMASVRGISCMNSLMLRRCWSMIGFMMLLPCDGW